MPFSERSTSVHPVNRFSLFQMLSPCRTSMSLCMCSLAWTKTGRLYSEISWLAPCSSPEVGTSRACCITQRHCERTTNQQSSVEPSDIDVIVHCECKLARLVCGGICHPRAYSRLVHARAGAARKSVGVGSDAECAVSRPVQSAPSCKLSP